MVKKIAILGAGNAGFAFSGHLSIKGFEVRLYEDPRFEKNLEDVRSKGGIEVIGAVKGFGKIALASTDIKPVLSGAEVVMIAVPAFAQMTMFEDALPYLEDGQIIVFWPGNYGSIVAKKLMKENNIYKDIRLVDTASLIYATRKAGENKVDIFIEKEILPIACLPASDTQSVIKVLERIVPQVVPSQNVLEIGLNNVNFVLHCCPTILNAGWIDYTKGNFEFFRHGYTESICRVIEKVDEEKLLIGRALGLELYPVLDLIKKYYPSEKGDTIYEYFHNSRLHGGHGPNAPKSIKERYLSEDVPFGLVTLSSIGKYLNIQTPTVDSLILLASILNKEDYCNSGRNLESLGFSKLSKEDIIDYVNNG